MKLSRIILAAAFLGIVLALSACGGGNNKTLNLFNYGDYLDDKLVEAFEKETGIKVKQDTFDTNEDMYEKVAGGAVYDLIIAGDYTIEKMIKNGYTYETSDGIYFDTSKFANYADFARLDLEGLKAGARIDYSTEKRNPSDFAVWKFIKPGENHAMRWDFLGRPGYPGWHLECSTIIHTLLGEPIDIHTGGIDHIPVHHTNEIAQTFGAFGQKLANY